MTRKALCVQAFNKADTVIETLTSLSRCAGARDFDLLVVQDGLEGSRFKDKYADEHRQTQAVIRPWVEAHGDAFKSARFIPEDQGRGTAGTARVAIDHSLQDHDWVMFTEDDVIFEADALTWFTTMIDHPAFLRDDVWAIAGESKFFDSRGNPVSDTRKAEALAIATELEMVRKFCYHSWLPSSCFATTTAKWAEFGETRGLARGPKMVNDRCQAEGKISLWPVVARACDIGMHHTIGYSMTIHKKPEKIPQKSCYLTSRDVPAQDGPIEQFKDDGRRVYHRFSLDFDWLASEV